MKTEWIDIKHLEHCLARTLHNVSINYIVVNPCAILPISILTNG